MKKLAFVVALVAFVIGFSDLQENLFFWLGRPVGAIAFILYFILMILEKESAQFDEENKHTLERTPTSSPQRQPLDQSKRVLTPAHH